MTKTPIESRWDALSPDPGRSVFQLVDASHPLRFYIGRDPDGNRMLLLVTAERPPCPKPMRAINIEVYDREDGNWSLLIRLMNPELGHLFALLCADLIDASRSIADPSKPIAFVVRRLTLWQRLLERAGSDVLSDAEVRGVAGELVFLSTRIIPLLGERTAVECWKGPIAADQDFQLADTAWEVKTARPDAIAVQVASEDQLFSASRQIFLVEVRLGENSDPSAPGCFSLNALVTSLRSRLSVDPDASERFEERLSAVGYLTRAEYDEPIFAIDHIRIYEVREGFPRIVRPDLPAGVQSVRYQLLLDACTPYLVETLKDVRPLDGA